MERACYLCLPLQPSFFLQQTLKYFRDKYKIFTSRKKKKERKNIEITVKERFLLDEESRGILGKGYVY